MSTPPKPLYAGLEHTAFTYGDEGDDIILLQNMLIALGFDPGEADGVYGDQLKKAIKNFQMYAGLSSDGIAGKPTVDALVERYEYALETYNSTDKPLAGRLIGIDPGHQRDDNDDLEPVMPGSNALKKKVSAGTYGRYTEVSEYVINLQVGLKLKKELESLGAEVVMTRQTHDVNISNAERGMMMNEAGVDCWVRIHANGTDDPDTHGMFILVPDQGYMNTDADSIMRQSVTLAECLLRNTVEATGAKDLGIKFRTDQTGFGWSSVPVCNIEMGHMTNMAEDFLLVSEQYQNKIVGGICKGFQSYFEQFMKAK